MTEQEADALMARLPQDMRKLVEGVAQLRDESITQILQHIKDLEKFLHSLENSCK